MLSNTAASFADVENQHTALPAAKSGPASHFGFLAAAAEAGLSPSSRNLIRIPRRYIKPPNCDAIRLGYLRRMGTFGRPKTSNTQRNDLDWLQAVLRCLRRPTILVWSDMPVSVRAAKTSIYNSTLFRRLALPRTAFSPTRLRGRFGNGRA